MRRFCVLRSTPRPALEMYSSCPQSSVTVPWTLSRKDWAAGDWAASSRPVSTTDPSGPNSIASMLPPCSRPLLSSRRFRCLECQRDPALPALLCVFVLHRFGHPSYEVQSKSARRPLFDRRVDVHLGRLRDVESVHIFVD